MAKDIGVRLSIDGDASGAKRAADEAAASLSRLSRSSKDLPTFMGSGGSMPSFHSGTTVPPITQPMAGAYRGLVSPNGMPLTSMMPGMLPGMMPGFNSPYLPQWNRPGYGTNSFYGQTSPGGILPDGRKAPNTDQKITELTEQLEKLGETIEGVTEDLTVARNNKDLGSEYQLSGTLQNLKATEKQMKNELKNLEKDTGKRDPGKAIGDYFAAHLARDIAQSVVAGGNTIMGAKKALAAGDAVGADAQLTKGIGTTVGNLAGGGIGAIIGTLIAPGVGTAIGAGIGSSLGGFIGGLKGDKKEIDANYVAQYKKALPSIDMFYQRFGKDIEKKSGGQNSSEGLGWYNKAAQMSMGTGKTTAELMEAASNRGAYGNFSAMQSLTGARQDIMWERFTGANLGNIQKLSGTAMRYGGDDKAVQSAYAGLTASGMGKGQFDEFLTSMQRIMEDGIEKGFVKGAGEIAGNMTLLSKLSGGNPLWTGEQGAKRLMKMDEGTASATSLQSVTDVATFSVARDLLGRMSDNEFKRLTGGSKTGTYIDPMMLVERGVSADMIKGQFEYVNELAPDNVAGQVEYFMKMFKLNYTGGKQVYDMAEKARRENWGDREYKRAENDIKAFQKDPELKSASQQLQDVLTSLDSALVNLGAANFGEQLVIIQRQATDVRNILNHLKGVTETTAATEALAAAVFIEDSVPKKLVDWRGGNETAYKSNFLEIVKDTEKGGNEGFVADEFNNEVVPHFPGIGRFDYFDGTNDDLEKSLLEGLYQLQMNYVGMKSGGIDDREFAALKGILENIKTLISEFKDKGIDLKMVVEGP